jgi:hypothetical protein
MTKWDSYNWRDFKVEKREQIPTTPHFQALIFTQRSEWTPPYDHHDSPGGTSYNVSDVHVYAFKKKEELELFVTEVTKSGASFVFFAVSALGKSSVKVEVAMDV